MSVLDAPSRGYKECAACHKFVPVSRKECPNCGAKLGRVGTPAPSTLAIEKIDSEEDFGDLEVEVEASEDTPRVSLKPATLEYFNDPRYFPRHIRDGHEASVSAKMCQCRKRVVVTPSGICPHKLTSTEKEDVEAWAEKVMEAGHENGVHYAPSAIRYFVRQFFPMTTPADQGIGCNDQYLQAVGHLLDSGFQSRRHPNCPEHLKFTDDEGYCIACGEK